MKKSAFVEATKGRYNTVIEFEGHLISITGWKSKPWELVTDKNFEVTSERSYVPLASFRTREDLWNHLKTI